MKKYIIQVLVIVMTGIPCVGIAQVSGDIILGTQYDNQNRIFLSWIPKNDTIWASSLESPFTLVRTDENMKSEVLATGIAPQSLDWFESMNDLGGGFVYAIGHILYEEDTTQVNAGLLMSLRHDQYHYLMPEAIRDPFIAEALGLGFVDSTVEANQIYTYEVFFEDALGIRHQGEIEVDLKSDNYKGGMEALREMKFDPPGGSSLLDMRFKDVVPDQLHVVGKAYGDSIVLRWAPSNVAYWNRTREKSYAVLRMERGTEGDSTYFEYVLKDSVRIWRLEEFTPEKISQDSLILIAAQTLYGKQLSTEDDGIILQHSEYVMRYGMAMLVADRSPLAATALGLRYVDKDVKPGETYNYVVLTRAAANIMENGFLNIQNEIDTLNRINNFYAEPGDLNISLKWSKLNDQRFTGYLLGRSDDGGTTFQTLTDAPLLIIQSQDSDEEDDYEFLDTIPANYYPYVYCIQGIDAFGDTSLVTITEAHGVDLTPPDVPLVYFAETDTDGKILLKWEISDQDEDLDKFHILLSENIDGDYTPIAMDLQSTSRSYKFEESLNTSRSYYFMIVAQDTVGNQSSTLPIYVHLIDSIPPTSPVGLLGTIDSAGVVTITWDHNEESDLIGYRVYMANNPNHEFSQITQEVTLFNMWRDTVTLEALDKKVYYKVIAEDQSHNYSDFSEILVLDRPDIIPPAAPAILPTSSDENGIQLFWRPSPSNDVIAYIIYRRNVSLEDTIRHRIVRIQDKNATEWSDTSAIPETIYEYTIQAQDQSALLSEFTFPVKGRRRFDLSSLNIDQVEAEYREEYGAVYLRWYYKPTQKQKDNIDSNYFYIYRKSNEGAWKKIKQLTTSQLSFLDRDIGTEEEITYGIKVITVDGKSGLMAESPIVKLTN